MLPPSAIRLRMDGAPGTLPFHPGPFDREDGYSKVRKRFRYHQTHMYSPKFNQVADRAILLEAMRAYSFAILTGPQSGPDFTAPLVATHLPLVVKDEGPAWPDRRSLRKSKPALEGACRPRSAGDLPRPAQLCFADALYRASLRSHVELHCGSCLRNAGAGRRGSRERSAACRPDRGKLSPRSPSSGRTVPGGFDAPCLREFRASAFRSRALRASSRSARTGRLKSARNVQAAHAAGDADEQALAAWMARLILSQPVSRCRG